MKFSKSISSTGVNLRACRFNCCDLITCQMSLLGKVVFKTLKGPFTQFVLFTIGQIRLVNDEIIGLFDELVVTR